MKAQYSLIEHIEELMQKIKQKNFLRNMIV